MSKSIGRKNQFSGKYYEDDIALEINSLRLFPPLGSSQDYNKEADKNKIDISPKDSKDIFEYDIQAKVSTNKVVYPKLLEEVAERGSQTPVLLHRYVTKEESGRSLLRDKFAIMYQEDFIKLIGDVERYKRSYEELMCYWDSISDEQKPLLDERLKELGV